MEFTLLIGDEAQVFKWKKGEEAIASFGSFVVVMTHQGTVLVLPKQMREVVLGMEPEHDRIVTPEPEEPYEEAFAALRDLSFEYYPKDVIKNIKRRSSPPRGPEEHAKDKAIMDEHDMAHQVADCQFQDGSVLVEWQGVEGEGTVEAEVGSYETLGDALAACPLATPVCPGCDPHLAENGRDTVHKGECSPKEMGYCESALSP